MPRPRRPVRPIRGTYTGRTRGTIKEGRRRRIRVRGKIKGRVRGSISGNRIMVSGMTKIKGRTRRR